MTASRRIASAALAVAGAFLLLLGGLLLYARGEILDSDAFADRAAATLADERVEEALTAPIVNAIVDAGPAELINAQPILEAGVGGVIDSASFRRTFRDAVRTAHAALVTDRASSFALDLADAGVLAIQAVRSISPEVAARIPGDVEPELIEVTDSDLALEVTPLVHEVRTLGIVLPLLGLALLAGSVALAPVRRAGTIRAAAAVAVGAGAVVALALVGRSLVLGQFDDEVVHDAAAAGWDAFLGDLVTWFGALGAAAVIVAATAYAGVRAADPAAPARRLAAIASWRPERPALRLARAAAILGLSLLVVLHPEGALHVAVVAIAGWGLLVGATEVMLVLAPPPAPGAGGDRRASLARRLRPRRALAAAGVAAGALAAIAVIVLGGGDRDAVERPPGPPEACNGHPELCARSLAEVSFPATHNSMSAAREPGWYLPNQRHGIDRQLDDGIRALLIDTHYGVETEDGTVVTDLERETATREEIAAVVGEAGVDRVERIRERLAGDADSAEARPYLCHVFCELGATELTAALTEVREFLDRHPDELVVLFVEDVVTPEDAAPAFEASGILRYAYVHRRDEPLPTLGELIEADRRVVILGENHSGGASLPWYHDGFELVQETPYTFDSPEQLVRPAACRPNRGTRHSPLFQINHWIERVPRSPDLAAEVNAAGTLLDRARACRRRRGLLPNLVAVDHYDRGDLLEVVNVLNRLGRDAEPRIRVTG